MLKICLVFCKSEPRYAYKLHAYKKKHVCTCWWTQGTTFQNISFNTLGCPNSRGREESWKFNKRWVRISGGWGLGWYLKMRYEFILFIPIPGLIHSFSTRIYFLHTEMSWNNFNWTIWPAHNIQMAHSKEICELCLGMHMCGETIVSWSKQVGNTQATTQWKQILDVYDRIESSNMYKSIVVKTITKVKSCRIFFIQFCLMRTSVWKTCQG